MASQLGALRDALIEAGAKPEKADKASEELAGYENRLAGIDLALAAIRASMTALEARMTSVEVRMNMLMGVVTLNVALTAGVLWRLLAHA